MIVRAAKTSLMLSMMGAFAARTFALRPRGKGKPGAIARKRWYTEQTSRWCRRGTKIMNMEVEVENFDPERFRRGNFLLVGNHMSYVDVLALSSKLPCVFVTSVDMRQAPVLGELAELGGSIFVERRNRLSVDRDLGAMTEALRDGFNVAIYPEGTSTDGQRVLPFKKSLLMSAAEAGRDIVPFCLRYEEIDGKPFGPSNADVVCWYGDMSFAPHFARLLAAKSIKAKIVFLEPIRVTSESTRTELAERCHDAIEAAYFKGRESLRAPDAPSAASSASTERAPREAAAL